MKVNWDKVDQPEIVLQRFPSRRSVVYGTKGVVSSSQPLATEAGLEILRKGGNAGMKGIDIADKTLISNSQFFQRTPRSQHLLL